MSKLLVLCLIIGVACGATFRGKAPKKPDHLAHKEGCYVEQVDDVIAYGSEVAPIGICLRIDCGADMLSYATCGAIFTNDSKCHKTEPNLTKPYPDCCPTIKCDPENHV